MFQTKLIYDYSIKYDYNNDKDRKTLSFNYISCHCPKWSGWQLNVKKSSISLKYDYYDIQS